MEKKVSDTNATEHREEEIDATTMERESFSNYTGCASFLLRSLQDEENRREM